MISTLGAFLWENPKTHLWSQIIRIMVHQRNRKIHSGQGFVASFDGGMIRMIWDDKFVLGFSQRNALLVWFVFSFVQDVNYPNLNKENTNQSRLKSFWLGFILTNSMITRKILQSTNEWKMASQFKFCHYRWTLKICLGPWSKIFNSYTVWNVGENLSNTVNFWLLVLHVGFSDTSFNINLLCKLPSTITINSSTHFFLYW